MLNERKLTERELESREVVLQGLLKNKRNLVKKYGKDAEQVMYGIATKKAKSKVENMNKDRIKELIQQSLTKEDATPQNKDNWADYTDIGQFYIENSGRRHSLTQDELEHLGKEIVTRLYKGDIGRAYDEIVRRVKEDNDPSGADLEGDPDEKVMGENTSQDNAVTELRNIVDELEEKAEEAREIVRQYFPNELSRLDGYGVFDVAYSGNRYNVTLGKFVDGLEEGDYDDLDDEDYPMQEVGNINRKGEEIPDSDKEAFKKRPSVGLGALLKKEAVIRKKLGKAPKAGKVTSKQKMKLPSGIVSYMDFTESIYEKLTKKNDVGDFVDDFKKSDAKQFKGKSAKKKKEMAVAAYLSKQND